MKSAYGIDLFFCFSIRGVIISIEILFPIEQASIKISLKQRLLFSYGALQQLKYFAYAHSI